MKVVVMPIDPEKGNVHGFPTCLALNLAVKEFPDTRTGDIKFYEETWPNGEYLFVAESQEAIEKAKNLIQESTNKSYELGERSFLERGITLNVRTLLQPPPSFTEEELIEAIEEEEYFEMMEEFYSHMGYYYVEV